MSVFIDDKNSNVEEIDDEFIEEYVDDEKISKKIEDIRKAIDKLVELSDKIYEHRPNAIIKTFVRKVCLMTENDAKELKITFSKCCEYLQMSILIITTNLLTTLTKIPPMLNTFVRAIKICKGMVNKIETTPSRRFTVGNHELELCEVDVNYETTQKNIWDVINALNQTIAVLEFGSKVKQSMSLKDLQKLFR